MIQDPEISRGDVANLAHEQNLLSVLPLARLNCCFCGTKQIIDGISSTQKGTLTHLCPDNKRRCLLAYRRILRLQANSTFAWCRSEAQHTTCQSAVECSLARKNIIMELLFELPDGWEIMGTDLWDEGWEVDMCAECVDMCKESHATGRREFWLGLPGVFDLPPWEELEKERLITVRYYCSRPARSSAIAHRFLCVASTESAHKPRIMLSTSLVPSYLHHEWCSRVIQAG